MMRSLNLAALLHSLCNQTDKKYFGIMVQYWDRVEQQPVTSFLCMPVFNIATAQSVFTAIEQEIDSR